MKIRLKKCIKCLRYHPEENFHWTANKKSRFNTCKPCAYDYYRAWKAAKGVIIKKRQPKPPIDTKPKWSRPVKISDS